MSLDNSQTDSTTARFNIVVSALLLAVISLNDLPLAHSQDERITDPMLLETGEKLFQENCAVCHGN
jgi:mono/diheme cytochrome c family protein